MIRVGIMQNINRVQSRMVMVLMMITNVVERPDERSPDA